MLVGIQKFKVLQAIRETCWFPLDSYEGGWLSQYNDVLQFLQIDLGNVTMVTAIATQGHSTKTWWVKTYTLEYGNENGNFTAYNNNQASTWGQLYVVSIFNVEVDVSAIL